MPLADELSRHKILPALADFASGKIDQPMLPQLIQEIIKTAAGNANSLSFGGSHTLWHPLSEFRSLPNETAIYAIGLRLGVQYPSAISRIIYFGSTAKLRDRMRSYAGGGHNERLDLLHRRFSGCLECSFHLVPGLDLQWRRALEDAALTASNSTFGCYPLCNMAPIDSALREAFKGIVTVSPCEGLPFPQSIPTLNCGDGVMESYPLEKRGRLNSKRRSSTIQITFRVSDQQPIIPDRAIQDGADEESAKHRDLEYLTWITGDNVAMWTEEKMRRIITNCKQLIEAKPSGKTQVITFDAPVGRVPRPDTWGEVALLKARELAGTFYPEKRMWLKVRFKTFLLGQAILEKNFFRGEDKSDLPQTKRRSSIYKNPEWLRILDGIHGTLPEDFRPVTPAVPQLPEMEGLNPTEELHRNLLSAARQFDLQEDRHKTEFDQQMALDQDRYTKAREILNERIESKYRAATHPR